MTGKHIETDLAAVRKSYWAFRPMTRQHRALKAFLEDLAYEVTEALGAGDFAAAWNDLAVIRRLAPLLNPEPLARDLLFELPPGHRLTAAELRLVEIAWAAERLLGDYRPPGAEERERRHLCLTAVDALLKFLETGYAAGVAEALELLDRMDVRVGVEDPRDVGLGESVWVLAPGPAARGVGDVN